MTSAMQFTSCDYFFFNYIYLPLDNHYRDIVFENEVPYKDVLHLKVKL